MTFKAAVVQTASIPFNKQATVEKVVAKIREAAELGAKLIVFPEATISGYPKGSDFGARVGGRLPRGREEFLRYFNGAITVPGPEVDEIAAAAREAQAYVVVGVMEQEIGTLYCTALHFSPSGEMIGKHRKLMPTAVERLIWGYGDGSTLPVFNTPHGKMGTVICWENYMPLLRMAMYGKGIQLYCAPTADDRDEWITSMRHIAMEGRCFVFSACQYITRGDYPEDYDAIQGNSADTVLMRGGSAIISPAGQLLAGPDYEGECILTADIDLDDVTRGKYDFDVVGHYARPDIFKLVVDETPKPPVVTIGQA
ncbi:carbon-nitrogen hydrolase family protein [Achromobacter sp.]|uniref:carbon-nitrogen hydrolase family protein n=1 Tax=Achromobacter sp. TaxID=134375 RepID=UPI003C730B62